MKKVVLLFCMMIVFIVFSFSTPIQHTPLAAQKITVVTYHANIAPLIQANCSPCHFRANGGKKKRLDSYASVSSQIDEILRRIQLNPASKKFMPTKLSKLSDSVITVFKQWKADGLLER